MRFPWKRIILCCILLLGWMVFCMVYMQENPPVQEPPVQEEPMVIEVEEVAELAVLDPNRDLVEIVNNGEEMDYSGWIIHHANEVAWFQKGGWVVVNSERIEYDRCWRIENTFLIWAIDGTKHRVLPIGVDP